jgi:hypothetical protein
MLHDPTVNEPIVDRVLRRGPGYRHPSPPPQEDNAITEARVLGAC